MTRARDLADFNLDGKAVTINESSADLDFRVESNGNANMLVVDAGNDRIGIGTNTPAHDVEIVATAAGSVNDSLQIRNNATSSGTGSRIRFINSTDNTSDANGASISSIRNGDDNDLVFETENATRMTIDHAGNVGIGQSSPQSNINSSTKVLHLKQDSTNGSGVVMESSNCITEIIAGNDASYFYNYTSDPMIFGANNTEAMRIEPTYGRLLINRTSAASVGPYSKLHVLGDSAVDVVTLQVGTNGYSALVFLNASGVYSGGITVSSGSVSYNTASDYRLKENVADMTGAIDRVKALAPKRFNFIVDADTMVDGFLAHEAQTVVPEAVTGTHNETRTITNAILSSDGKLITEDVTEEDWTAGKKAREDDDGNAVDAVYPSDSTWSAKHTEPVMQGIDQAKLVPLLTGALQEAIAKIETLETEMTALKARVTTLEGE